MGVGIDAVSEQVRTATTDPFTFSHTGQAQGSGGVQGVLVAVINGTTATDEVNAITYGGVALARQISTSDTATEPGRAQWWWADAVPGGTQTVSVDFTSATGTDQHIVVVTLTGAAALVVQATGSVNENTSDPLLVIDRGPVGARVFTAVYSGLASPANLTPVGTTTAIHDNDFGNFVSRVDRSPGQASGNLSVGYTSAIDDLAMVVIAISEYAPDGTTVPYVGGSNNGGNSTTPSITLPNSGLSPGDHILIRVDKNNSSYVPSTPSGYTLVQSAVDGDDSAYLFSKPVAAGSDLGSVVTFTTDAGTSKWTVLCVVYRGGDATNFVTQSDQVTEGSTDATHNSPGLNMLFANSRYVGFIAEQGGGTTSWTPPSGLTLRQANYQTGGGPIAAGVADYLPGSTGGTGGKVWTQDVGTSPDSVGFSVEIAPLGSTLAPAGYIGWGIQM